MKILRKTVCKRENALDFLRCAGKRDGITHYRYWLVLSGWKYEIEATKEEAEHLRTAGDITSIVRLLAIMLVQLHQETGESLEELVNYFEMQVICAKEVSEAYKPHAPEEGE